MSALTDIEWEACVLSPSRNPELERFVREALGFIPDMLPYYFACPWIVRCVVFFDEGAFRLRHTPVEVARLVALVISQENSCRFCYAASRAVLRLLGFADQRIERLETELLTPTGASVKPLLDFARALARADLVAAVAEKQSLLGSGYAEEAVRELAFVIAVHVYHNRLATLPALPTDLMERRARSRLLPLVRPFMRRFFKPRPDRLRTPDDLPDRGGVPYGYLVDAFADLPLAVPLARALSEAWASTFLSRRAKALLFAVIARGLGSSRAEREAAGILATEGLSQTAIDQSLTHLAAPDLDPIEAVIMPFARETVWYRPVQIQRSTRALTTQLSSGQLLEVIGIAALANAICRLNVVLPAG